MLEACRVNVGTTTAVIIVMTAICEGCERPKASAEPTPEATSAPPAKVIVKSCRLRAGFACTEFADRPDLASQNCEASTGDVLDGPCPPNGRVGSCTMLLTNGSAAHTARRYQYAGGTADGEARCKAAGGTWRL